jgi:hypothetical protein
MSKQSIAKIYYSKDLYGNRMVELREALEDAGFELSLDPIEDKAILYDLEED